MSVAVGARMNRSYAAVVLAFFLLSSVGCQAEPTPEDEDVEASAAALGEQIVLSDAVLIIDGVSIPVTATASYQANVKFPEITLTVSGDEMTLAEWDVAVDDKSGTMVGEIEGVDPVQKKRRRATFSGACVTEVKLDDLDANNNKKPYQITYRVPQSQFTIVDESV